MKEKALIREFLKQKSMRGTDTLEDVGDGDSLFEKGVLDSLRLLELIAYVEKTFAVRISMSQISMERFESIIKIAELIRENQKKKN